MLSRIQRERHPEADDGGEPAQGVPREESMLALQRGMGNRALQRLLKSDRGSATVLPYRSQMEHAFGENFAGVRVSTGQAGALAKVDASAAAMGDDVAFASSEPDPLTVAHELTHVVQARHSGESPPRDGAVSSPSDPAEHEARTLSGRVATGDRVSVSAAPSTAISLNPNPAGTIPTVTPAAANISVFEKPDAAASASGAAKAIDEYGKLSAGDRRKAFDLSFASGALARVLKILTAEDAAETYLTQARELIGWMEETDQPQARQLLRRVEEAESRKGAGQTDAQMAGTQAQFMSATPKKKDAIKGTAYAPAAKTRWELLSSDDKRKGWTKRGVAAITSEVAYAAKTHPELKLTTASFKLGFKEIDEVAEGALAMGGTVGGKDVAVVGFEFVTAVEADPAYALSTVVHEIWGHPEFDNSTNYQLELWRKATPKVPGYSASATTEENSIGYDESEIYSLLRELPYWTAVAPQHKGVDNPDPRDLVEGRLRRMEKEWEPSVLASLLHGLFKRFSLDAHITAMALAAFAALIKKRFPKEAANILK